MYIEHIRGKNNNDCSKIFCNIDIYFLEKKIKIGAETYIDEYVPNAMPKESHALNPLKASPPKISRATQTTIVVNDVIIVLERVSLILLLIKSQNLLLLIALILLPILEQIMMEKLKEQKN